MNSILRTDLTMGLLFLLSLFTGIQVHYAGHFQSHEIWHNWSVAHVLINMAFTIATLTHIWQHKGWFQSLLKKITLRKKITLFVTVTFLGTFLSGLYLLAFAEGENTPGGLVHYWIGMIFSFFGIGHTLKRWKILSSAFK